MKKLLLLAFLFSCSNNKNDRMTDLLNEKKAVEDSIVSARNNESYAHSQKNSDSEAIYWQQGRLLNKRLEAINFSIDSLSKMK